MATTTLRIHHATAKKAETAHVALTVDGDRYVAIDTLRDPDREFSGTSAPELLEKVLSLRPDHKSKSNGSGDEQDEGDDEEEEEEQEEEDLIEDTDEEFALVAEEEEGEEPEAGGSVVPEKYKKRYQEHDGTCGDAFAEALSVAGRDAKSGELDMYACAQIAADNGMREDWARWTAVQSRGFGGRARMNLGNRLRAAVRRGDTVVIGRSVFEPVLDEDGEPVKGEYRTNKSRGALR